MIFATLTLLVAPLAALPAEVPPDDLPAEASELEALRALEDVALDPAAGDDAWVLQTVQRLGAAHPLRLRLEDALDDADLRDDAPPALAPVTDLLAFDVSQVQDHYDIPIEMQPLVAQYIRLFQGPGRRWFRKWMERSTRFIPVMQPILEQYGVPKDTVYLAMIESGFSAQAYSWAHASGPWQFISETGKAFGLKQDFWVDERRDPIKSTHAAAKFLKHLHGNLGHWYLAWAGYNTGGGRIRRVSQKKGTTDFWELSEGRGLAKETKHYVPKLIAAALIAKHPSAFGFEEGEFEFQAPLEWDEVPLADATDIAVIARAAGVTEDEILEFNPELRRWCTPPASEEEPYLLRLPRGRKELFAENLAKIPKSERFKFSGHQVQKGDTLSAIARKYDSSVEAIMRLNQIKSPRALKLNAILMIPIPSGKPMVQARRSASVQRPHEEKRAGPRSTPAFHKLHRGETLWSISQRYGVTVDELKRWNDIRDHRALRAGQKLRLTSP